MFCYAICENQIINKNKKKRDILLGWTNDHLKGTGHPSLLCDNVDSVTDHALKYIFWSFPVKAHTEEKTFKCSKKGNERYGMHSDKLIKLNVKNVSIQGPNQRNRKF